MTGRGLALLLAPLLLVAMAAADVSMVFPGVGLFVAAAVAILIDGRRAPGPGQVRVVRHCDRLLSLGVANLVVLEVRAPAGARLRLRDESPSGIPASASVQTLVGTGRVEYTLSPRVRGSPSFGVVAVRSEGPWRLGTRDFSAAEPVTVRIDPNIAAVRVYEALARRGQLAELGMRTARRQGGGSDFERVREAVPEDSLRTINARATARTGRLMANELAPERDQPVIVCLDHGRLMGVGAGELTKFDHAVNAGLLLMHVALRTGDRAGLLAFTNVVTTEVAPRTGSGQLTRLLEALGPLRAVEVESDFGATLSSVHRTQRRRALIVIFTDVLDRDQAASLIAACALLRRRHLPLVITVRDPAVEELAHRPPADVGEVFQRAVAGGILDERAMALRLLRGHRVDVIDGDARDLSPRLVNRYLELKRRASI